MVVQVVVVDHDVYGVAVDDDGVVVEDDDDDANGEYVAVIGDDACFVVCL